jgi:hypothetical protein
MINAFWRSCDASTRAAPSRLLRSAPGAHLWRYRTALSSRWRVAAGPKPAAFADGTANHQPVPSSIPAGGWPCASRVAPFGYLRLTGCQRLPEAFRRVAASFLGCHRLGIHHAPLLANRHLLHLALPPHTLAGTGSARAMETRSPSPHNSDTSPPHIACAENQTVAVDRAFLFSVSLDKIA